MSRDIFGASSALLRQLELNVGARTVGELSDILNNASDEERTRLINEADEPLQVRKQAEGFQSWAAGRHVEHRDEGGYAWLVCSHENCPETPHDENGLARMLNVRRWWCDRHRDQARAGDGEQWAPPIGVNPRTGGLVDLEAQAVEHQRAERDARRLAAQREVEQAERQAEPHSDPDEMFNAWTS